MDRLDLTIEMAQRYNNLMEEINNALKNLEKVYVDIGNIIYNIVKKIKESEEEVIEIILNNYNYKKTLISDVECDMCKLARYCINPLIRYVEGKYSNFIIMYPYTYMFYHLSCPTVIELYMIDLFKLAGLLKII